ncbi:MAG: ribonucleoside-triphosphate reductase [Patescibacteria group bacterium]|nr:ribonucleoside-triphosphate reductase [Patescibacteria group bacterium]MDE2438359.1 ribonucleoside-triphosphate reductase [Patescibacteria group bacterium]
MAKQKAMFKEVKKRDGRLVPWDQSRITNAIKKAMSIVGEGDAALDPPRVSNEVVKILGKRFSADYAPQVEEIQDVVEEVLIALGFSKTAKEYILYREGRAKQRAANKIVPEHVKALVEESKQYFRNNLSEFVFYQTYARWIEAENRRETWVETVDRYIDFMREHIGAKLKESEYAEIREYMLNMKALGSMRLVQFAGKAARSTNVAAYNCSFIAPKEWQDFGEIVYILMCGTGVGFSVEEQTIGLLPIIKRQVSGKAIQYAIPDSREGWADALVYGLKTWAEGKDVVFDYSKLRPRGARLKTMGGRSSGPEPLKSLLTFARERMLKCQGRRLKTIDAHDIICKIGDTVVAGGVRRSALLSLSDLDDLAMREAKNGQFYLNHPERSMANNSVAYNEKPSMAHFLDEWVNLAKAGSGERGVFNRGSLKEQFPTRRWKLFEPDMQTSGTNPCGEIILKSKEFCNLSEVVARNDDTVDTLMDKVRVATILGTYQASLTNFPYLSPEWKKNCEEEALLGVSITGQWDCPALRSASVFRKLKEIALETNRKYAERFGINRSAAVTCVKPSGNGSQLFDSSSGMHPRHARYYIRRVRIEGHNPIFKMLRDMGVPYEPEVGQTKENATTYVVEFPIKAPAAKGTVYKDDLSAWQQLEYWKMVKENFTEHNPSTTISVGEDEWLRVGAWVHENWDMIGGLSFLPRSNHVYRLAPYEEITAEKYAELSAKFPKIDFSKLVLYENEDMTEVKKELACVSGVCEVDFEENPTISTTTL